MHSHSSGYNEFSHDLLLAIIHHSLGFVSHRWSLPCIYSIMFFSRDEILGGKDYCCYDVPKLKYLGLTFRILFFFRMTRRRMLATNKDTAFKHATKPTSFWFIYPIQSKSIVCTDFCWWQLKVSYTDGWSKHCSILTVTLFLTFDGRSFWIHETDVTYNSVLDFLPFLIAYSNAFLEPLLGLREWLILIPKVNFPRLKLLWPILLPSLRRSGTVHHANVRGLCCNARPGWRYRYPGPLEALHREFASHFRQFSRIRDRNP